MVVIFFFHNHLLKIKMLRPGLLVPAAPCGLKHRKHLRVHRLGGRGKAPSARGGPRASHQQKCLCLFLGDRPEKRRVKRGSCARLQEGSLKIKNDQRITGFRSQED